MTESIHVPRPELKYPNMCITQARFLTFESWSNTEIVDIESLVNAGFFYTGNQDHVRCFDCGIGLRNWEPEDDPTVEHARWSPSCRYVREKKGQEFIDTVQAAVRQIEIENLMGQSRISLFTNSTENEEYYTEASLQRDILPCGRPPTSVERKNPLLMFAAQALVEFQYLPKTVKMAIDIVLEDKGWRGLTSANLLDTIININRNDQLKDINITQPYFQDRFRVARYRTLEMKQRMIQENRDMRDRMSCKICCEDHVSIAFLPCGHLVSCSQCAPSLANCPVCRTEVKGSFKVCF